MLYFSVSKHFLLVKCRQTRWKYYSKRFWRWSISYLYFSGFFWITSLIERELYMLLQDYDLCYFFGLLHNKTYLTNANCNSLNLWFTDDPKIMWFFGKNFLLFVITWEVNDHNQSVNLRRFCTSHRTNRNKLIAIINCLMI